MNVSRIVIAVLGIVSGSAALAQTQVPHKFSSGQPARASEVNENFDALSSHVDANSEAISAAEASLANRLPPVVVDGNGNEIGQLISIGENLSSLIAITQAGYLVNISFWDGSLPRNSLSYESSDCSGTPYASFFYAFSGLVFRSYDSLGNPGVYYIDKAAVPVTNLNICSSSFEYPEPGCQPGCGAAEPAWPVSINDPAVTGVSNTTYPLPIRFDRAN